MHSREPNLSGQSVNVFGDVLGTRACYHQYREPTDDNMGAVGSRWCSSDEDAFRIVAGLSSNVFYTLLPITP